MFSWGFILYGCIIGFLLHKEVGIVCSHGKLKAKFGEMRESSNGCEESNKQGGLWQK